MFPQQLQLLGSKKMLLSVVKNACLRSESHFAAETHVSQVSHKRKKYLLDQ